MTEAPMWKRILLRFFQTVVLVGAVVIFFELAVLAYPPVFILVTPGRTSSPYCTTWKAFVESKVLISEGKIRKSLFAASRVVQRDGLLELWATPKGRFWIPTEKPSTPVGHLIFGLGVGLGVSQDYEQNILPLLLAQQDLDIYGDRRTGVRRGDVVFDLGAHVGVYVRKALDAGASKIIAVEPTPDAVECLRRNFPAETASGRVVVVPKGIWDQNKILDLYRGGSSGAGNSFVNEAGIDAETIHGIPVTSIDGLVAELKLKKVDFIKADIKGATARMLKGAAGTIQRFNPRMALSTEEPPDDPKAISETLFAIAPAYTMTCGPCLLRGSELRNDVIFFRRQN